MDIQMNSVGLKVAEAFSRKLSAYDRGYRDALESVVLAYIGGHKDLDDLIQTALDAFTNNVD